MRVERVVSNDPEDGRRAKLAEILGAFSTVTVDAVAERLNVAEATVLRLAHELGARPFTRAGAKWLTGRRPKWRVREDKPSYAL
jgi:hypothetical protein